MEEITLVRVSYSLRIVAVRIKRPRDALMFLSRYDIQNGIKKVSLEILAKVLFLCYLNV